MAKSTNTELALCSSRRRGHTWNDPANQHWEWTDPVMVGRRRTSRIRCVGTCDRCQSQRIEAYLVDKKNCLAERDTRWYRHSPEYRERDRLAPEQLVWFQIPAEIRAAL